MEVLPFPDLVEQAHALGHVHVELDADAVVRGTYLYQGLGQPHWPHLMLEFANYINSTLTSAAGANTSQNTTQERPQGFAHHDFSSALKTCNSKPGSPYNLQKCVYVGIPFAGPPNTYPQISSELLLTNEPAFHKALESAIKDNIVLIGLTATGSGDWVTSPISSDAGPMTGVEFNANLLSALSFDTTINISTDGANSKFKWIALVLSCLIVGLCSLLLPRMRPETDARPNYSTQLKCNCFWPG